MDDVQELWRAQQAEAEADHWRKMVADTADRFDDTQLVALVAGFDRVYSAMAGAALAPRTSDPAVLTNLALHEDARVRKAARNNPACPDEARCFSVLM